VIEPSPGQFSSDAGLLPIRQFDQRIVIACVFSANGFLFSLFPLRKSVNLS